MRCQQVSWDPSRIIRESWRVMRIPEPQNEPDVSLWSIADHAREPAPPMQTDERDGIPSHLTRQGDLEKALDESRKSEARLRKIIDTIPTLAWCNLPDGSNEFLNQRWHDYTGLSPQEAHGGGWKVAIHPEDLPLLIANGKPLAISSRVSAKCDCGVRTAS